MTIYSAGGVILTSHFGRIRINNTLEERLTLAQEEVNFVLFISLLNISMATLTLHKLISPFKNEKIKLIDAS